MPPSTSSSRLVVEQCTCLGTGLANDKCILRHIIIGHSDQDSLRTTSQAFLECLDRLNHHDRLYSTCKEIINTCLAAILAKNCQSEVAMWDESSWRYGNIDLQKISMVESQTPDTLDEAVHLPSTDFSLMPQPSALQGIYCQLRGQGHGLLSQESIGVAGTPAEGTDLSLDQLFPGMVSYIRGLPFTYHVRLDILLSGTSGCVSDKLGVQPFHPPPPQHGVCSEGRSLYGSSTSQRQELHASVAPGELSYEFTDSSQEKVKCTWPRCSRVIRKDNYTRHVNETHLKRVDAVCAHCERTFSRKYTKKKHEFTCHSRSKSL
jgi:uncharacterized C2H2 Zn-finger protein